MITKKNFKNQTKTWSKLENNMNPALKQVLVYLPISKLQLLSSTVFFHNIISQRLECLSIITILSRLCSTLSGKIMKASVGVLSSMKM